MPKQIHPQKSKRSRFFSVTIFADARPSKLEWMRYFCAQQEVCPTTGKKHWQSCFYTKDNMTLSAVIKSLPTDWNKPHVEIMRSSLQTNMAYCSKSESSVPGTFFEEGQKPSQGERSDLKEACSQVISGGLAAVTNDTMIVRYHKGLSVLQQVRASQVPHEYKKPNVYWHWGPTGTGKTKAAYDFDPMLYKQTSRDGWFDGYFNQKTICIDDYDADTFALRDILQILDGYRYMAKVKGGFVQLQATTIFITSHDPPEFYFLSSRFSEIFRRINNVVEHSITSTTSG